MEYFLPVSLGMILWMDFIKFKKKFPAAVSPIPINTHSITS
jgi:hypothetical protein